ncbi:MAG TPA: HAD family phosphatase [Candidatus Angelobacter sp.]|nr:HAD family phosphatase [Candidatus Angelobacter sp.]
MLRAVIFDLDGVVVDSHPTHKQAWRECLHLLGCKASELELEYVAEGHTRADILRHFLGDLTAEQVQQHGAFKDRLFRTMAVDLKPVRGLHGFLRQIENSGVPVGLASSGGRARVEDTLQQLKLQRFFQVVVTGEDVSRSKPDPAIFHLAAHGLHVTPEEILVCEDAVCGVEAAKAARMKCLAIATDGRNLRLEKAGADMVARDFTQVQLEELRILFEQPAMK